MKIYKLIKSVNKKELAEFFANFKYSIVKEVIEDLNKQGINSVRLSPKNKEEQIKSLTQDFLKWFEEEAEKHLGGVKE